VSASEDGGQSMAEVVFKRVKAPVGRTSETSVDRKIREEIDRAAAAEE